MRRNSVKEAKKRRPDAWSAVTAPRFGGRTALRLVGMSIVVFCSITACTSETEVLGGSGTIEAREIIVSAQTAGEVVAIGVAEGERVEAGDLLLEIDATDLELQARQLEHRLDAARLKLDLLQEGARSEDIRQARAHVREAEEVFALAEKTYQRTQSLYDAGSTSTSEMDRAETNYRQTAARLELAQAQLDLVLDASRPQEVRIGEANVAEIEAAIEQVHTRIRRASVVAPIDGTVITVVRDFGEYVGPGTPLLQIADLQTVHLTVYVPEPRLREVQIGQEAIITVDGSAEEFQGTVSRVAEEAEFTPKNVQTADARAQLVYAIEITIANPNGIFKIGMPAEARFIGGEVEDDR